MQRVPLKESHQEGIKVVLVVSSDLSVGPSLLVIMVATLVHLLCKESKTMLSEALLSFPCQVLLNMHLIKYK